MQTVEMSWVVSFKCRTERIFSEEGMTKREIHNRGFPQSVENCVESLDQCVDKMKKDH
jgi:hypothetical protein